MDSGDVELGSKTSQRKANGSTKKAGGKSKAKREEGKADDHHNETSPLKAVDPAYLPWWKEPEEAPPQTAGIVANLISGILCGVLMFAFCVVFAFIAFADELEPQVHTAVSMYTMMAFISGIVTTRTSSCRIAIAGPDINPTLFFAANRLLLRTQLGIENDSSEENVARLRSTLITTMVLGTLFVATTFIVLGKFRLTKIVSYIPAAVLSGFLASVGWNVVSEAITVATGIHAKPAHYGEIFGHWESWQKLFPALIIGIALYCQKRYHWGKATTWIPLILGIPFLVFYVSLFAKGGDINSARETGWFFPTTENSQFYVSWQEFFGNNKVVWSGIGPCIPNLIAMTVIAVMDILLKLAGTEKTLKVDIDIDSEVVLAGYYNYAGVLLVGPPAYSQLKFNALSHGIIHNTYDRLAGYISALFNGILFLAGFPLVNYLPRFFLSALVVYAGTGFLVENLWDTRPRFTRKDYCSVWVILGINYFAGLVNAVLIGLVLSVIIFAYDYSRRSDFRAWLTGQQFHSNVVRTDVQNARLYQLGRLVLIVAFKEVVFFGSAQKIVNAITDNLAKAKKEGLPPCKRLRYLILDFSAVTGLDNNAIDVFGKIKRKTSKNNLDIVYCGASPKIAKKLRAASLDPSDQMFEDQDHAMEWVEEQLLQYAIGVRSKWLILSPMITLNTFANINGLRGPIDHLAGRFSPVVYQYCRKEKIPEKTIIVNPGQPADKLYILLNGKVSTYLELSDGKKTRIASTLRGVFQSSILSAVGLDQHVVDKESTFLTFETSKWLRMEEEYPTVALRLQREILKDVAEARSRLEHFLDYRAKVTFTEYVKPDEKEEKISEFAVPVRVVAPGSGASSFDLLGFDEYGVEKPDSAPAKAIAENAALPRRYPQAVLQLAKRALTTNDSTVSIYDLRRACAPSIQFPLSRPQLAEYIFYFDSNATESKSGGGRLAIPKADLRKCFLDLGYYVTLKEFNTIIAPLRSDEVTLAQFLHVMGKVSHITVNSTQLKQYAAVFTVYDIDNSGSLDHAELKKLLTEVTGQVLSYEQVDEMIQDWVKLYKGELIFEEFLCLMSFNRKKENRDNTLQACFNKFISAYTEIEQQEKSQSGDEKDEFTNKQEVKEEVEEEKVRVGSENNPRGLLGLVSGVAGAGKSIVSTVADSVNFVADRVVGGVANLASTVAREGVKVLQVALNDDQLLKELTQREVEADLLEIQSLEGGLTGGGKGPAIRIGNIVGALKQFKGIDITRDEAEEMMWIADMDNNGYINFNGFAKLVSTVYQPGKLTRYDWKSRKPESFAYETIITRDLNETQDDVVVHPDDQDVITPAAATFNSPSKGELVSRPSYQVPREI